MLWKQPPVGRYAIYTLFPSAMSQAAWYFVGNTVKPVCNDHLYNEIYYLCFIQQRVLMITEGTHFLVLAISVFWGSCRWPWAT